MSDTPTAAAGRLLRYYRDNAPASAAYPGALSVRNRLARVRDDVVTVCESRLAEHPHTDAAPLSAAYLAAAGFAPVPFTARDEAGNPLYTETRYEKTLYVQEHDGPTDAGRTRHWLSVHPPQADAAGREWWPINYWQQHTDDEKPDGVTLLSWVTQTTCGHVRRLLAGLISEEGSDG